MSNFGANIIKKTLASNCFCLKSLYFIELYLKIRILSNLEAKYTHITLNMRYDSRPKEREANYSV